MTTPEKLKAVLAFPLAFLLGVLVMAVLQLSKVSGITTALILGGGMLAILLLDNWAGRTGNSAIVSAFARFTEDPEETRARIRAAEAGNKKPPFLVRLSQVAGFAAGALAWLIRTPEVVTDWIGSSPFL